MVKHKRIGRYTVEYEPPHINKMSEYKEFTLLWANFRVDFTGIGDIQLGLVICNVCLFNMTIWETQYE